MGKITNFFSNIKNAFTGDFSRQVKDNQSKYGKYTIQNVVICRDPIEKAIKMIVNTLSLGKVNNQQQKLGYDNIFHLYCILTLKNPNTNDIIYMKIEKNQTINIETSNNMKWKPKNMLEYQLNDNKKDLTFDLLIYLMEKKMGNKFVPYDAISNNCQVFIYNLIHVIYKYNTGDDTLPEKYKSFIMQDAGKLLQGSKIASGFSQGVTKTAGFFTRMIGGEIDVSEYDNFY